MSHLHLVSHSQRLCIRITKAVNAGAARKTNNALSPKKKCLNSDMANRILDESLKLRSRWYPTSIQITEFLSLISKSSIHYCKWFKHHGYSFENRQCFAEYQKFAKFCIAIRRPANRIGARSTLSFLANAAPPMELDYFKNPMIYYIRSIGTTGTVHIGTSMCASLSGITWTLNIISASSTSMRVKNTIVRNALLLIKQ